MIHLKLLSTAIMLMVFLNGGGGGKDCDINEKYEGGQCKPCPKCAVGSGLSSACGYGAGENLKCRPCPGGTYNHRHNGRRCLPCTNCTIYKRDYKFQCRPQVNAVCGSCIEGYYDAYSELGGGILMPCKLCSNYLAQTDCKRWEQKSSIVATTSSTTNEQTETKNSVSDIGTISVAIILGLAFLVLFGIFLCFFKWYTTLKNRVTEVTADSCPENPRDMMLRNGEEINKNQICTAWNDNLYAAKMNSSPSRKDLIRDKLKIKFKRELTSTNRREKSTLAGEVQSIGSNSAVKDSCSEGCLEFQSSTASVFCDDETDFTISEGTGLLDEYQKKTKQNSLRSISSKTYSSCPSSTANFDEVVVVNNSATGASLDQQHRSVSAQDNLIETNESNQLPSNQARQVVMTGEIPQADVRANVAVTGYSNDTCQDLNEMGPLVVRPSDVFDVASLVNNQSLCTGYSQASTVPIRGRSPSDGVRDLLSLDTMTDVLFPALVAEPRTNENQRDVDTCPDFGLRLPSTQNDGRNWVSFDNEDELARPPPAPSMSHIRQLLRYEFPLPPNTVSTSLSNQSREEVCTAARNTHVVAHTRPNDEERNTYTFWEDSEKELFDAESEAEILYKMVKILDGERYTRALRIAAEKQVGELSYEVQEQISLALHSTGIAGDKNYIHLAFRLGIPEEVINNLKGMMDVFGHLKMKRMTIGELLRTLRTMGRHDVVNLISTAILDRIENLESNTDDDSGDYRIPEQEQGHLIDKESCFPLPVQECRA